jgi:hypothetical protein
MLVSSIPPSEPAHHTDRNATPAPQDAEHGPHHPDAHRYSSVEDGLTLGVDSGVTLPLNDPERDIDRVAVGDVDADSVAVDELDCDTLLLTLVDGDIESLSDDVGVSLSLTDALGECNGDVETLGELDTVAVVVGAPVVDPVPDTDTLELDDGVTDGAAVRLAVHDTLEPACGDRESEGDADGDAVLVLDASDEPLTLGLNDGLGVKEALAVEDGTGVSELVEVADGTAVLDTEDDVVGSGVRETVGDTDMVGE